MATRILCQGNEAISGRHYKLKPQIVTRTASVFFGLNAQTNSRLSGSDARRSPRYRFLRGGRTGQSISGCAIGIRKISSVKLALHNAYFFRGSATPSNLIQQSVLNRPCYAQIIGRR
jgi:hypothetical protein